MGRKWALIGGLLAGASYAFRLLKPDEGTSHGIDDLTRVPSVARPALAAYRMGYSAPVAESPVHDDVDALWYFGSRDGVKAVEMEAAALYAFAPRLPPEIVMRMYRAQRLDRTAARPR